MWPLPCLCYVCIVASSALCRGWDFILSVSGSYTTLSVHSREKAGSPFKTWLFPQVHIQVHPCDFWFPQKQDTGPDVMSPRNKGPFPPSPAVRSFLPLEPSPAVLPKSVFLQSLQSSLGLFCHAAQNSPQTLQVRLVRIVLGPASCCQAGLLWPARPRHNGCCGGRGCRKKALDAGVSGLALLSEEKNLLPLFLRQGTSVLKLIFSPNVYIESCQVLWSSDRTLSQIRLGSCHHRTARIGNS